MKCLLHKWNRLLCMPGRQTVPSNDKRTTLKWRRNIATQQPGKTAHANGTIVSFRSHYSAHHSLRLVLTHSALVGCGLQSDVTRPVLDVRVAAMIPAAFDTSTERNFSRSTKSSGFVVRDFVGVVGLFKRDILQLMEQSTKSTQQYNNTTMQHDSIQSSWANKQTSRWKLKICDEKLQLHVKEGKTIEGRFHTVP